MTAIIKNRFRLQNAKDFLDNFKSHPRMKDGEPAPLINDITISSVNEAEKKATAQLTYSWSLRSDVTDFTNSNNNTQVRNDAIRGLIDSTGAHIKDRNHYLFVGKALPWGNSSAELTPPLAVDTLLEEKQVWHEMLGLKKISELDASLVVRRFDWDESKNTVYAKFDDADPALHRRPTPSDAQTAQSRGQYAGSFYCLNNDCELFVCIENGNGAKSTRKPQKMAVVTDLVDYRDFDGYLWKYITTLRPSDVSKFLTDAWIPVKTLGDVPTDESDQWTIEQNATAGQVLSVSVDSGGSNYTKTHVGQIASVSVVGGNTVVSLSAVAGGVAPSGDNEYYTGAGLYVTEGTGSGNAYNITAYSTAGNARNATLSGVATLGTDSKYVIGPRIIVESDSTTDISGRPIVENGVIKAVRLLSRGTNTTFVSLTVPLNSAQTSGGTQAQLRAILGPSGGLGKDPEKDLGAFYVMMSAKLAHTEGSGDFPLNNDYRQIGIIRDVLNPDGTLATITTMRATKVLTLANIIKGPNNATFASDEKFLVSTNGGTTWQDAGRVLEYADSPTQAGVGFLSFYKTFGILTNILINGASVKIKGMDSGTEATVIEVQNEEVKKFSGQILYLENRRPIMRSPDQIEDIKAIVEF